MKDLLTSNVPAVVVDQVSKRFCTNLTRSLLYGVQDTIHDLTGRSLATINLRTDEFWANHNVSFEVNRGECVGLIGHNGAGKTTILKMLNGLIKPDGGSITLRGRVGALIALGAGFNPVLTGRENIFINGAVLGLSRREVASQLEQIIDFAEIGDFIDTPVRSYSSGMQVRLGFAVATAMKPDILLIDEVLAVGDLDFRMKCITRISKLVDSNTAVVLVSHSMTDIQRICDRVIVMDHGRVAFDGDVSRGIATYESIGRSVRNIKILAGQTRRPVRVQSFSLAVNQDPAIKRYDFEIQTGDRLSFVVEYECERTLADARFRIFLDSKQAGIVASWSSIEQLGALDVAPGTFTMRLDIPEFPLRVGAYHIGASVHYGERNLHMPDTVIGELRVIGPAVPVSALGDAGLLRVKNYWKALSLTGTPKGSS